MNNKKKFGGLLILFSILLICYGIFSFFSKSNNESPIDVGQNLDNKITKEELEILEKRAKKAMAYARFFPIDSVSDIPNQFLIHKAILEKDISAKEVEDVLIKFWGSSLKINHEDYICSFDNKVYYDYDETTQTYLVAPSKSEEHNHLGSYDLPIFINSIFIQDAYKKADEYILDTKIIYVCNSPDSKIGDFYASYNDCIIDNPVPIVENPNGYLPSQSYVDLAGDKLPITTFTFYKENGNYVLKSVTINEDK